MSPTYDQLTARIKAKADLASSRGARLWVWCIAPTLGLILLAIALFIAAHAARV